MSDDHPWVERAARRLPRTTRRLVGTVALVFGVSGALLAFAIVSVWWVPSTAGAARVGSPESLGPLVGALGIALAAGLGAATAAAPLWWLVVERPGTVSLLRGGLVGALVGVLAHPLMWLFAVGGLTLGGLVVGGPTGLGTVDAGEVVGAVAYLLLFSVVGLVITGIVTVPVAAGTGLALAYVRARAEDLEPARRRHV